MSSTLGESVSNSDNGIQAIQRFQERSSSAIEDLGTRFGDLAMAQSSSANQTVSTDIGLASKSITHVPLKFFCRIVELIYEFSGSKLPADTTRNEYARSRKPSTSHKALTKI